MMNARIMLVRGFATRAPRLAMFTNVGARQKVLDEIDVANAKNDVDKYSAQLNVAFGHESFGARSSLKALAEIENSNPEAWSAALLAKADLETEWLDKLKYNKENLAGIIADLSKDHIRKSGKFAAERLPHYSPPDTDAPVVTQSAGNGTRRVLFTPWDSAGMDGGSVEDLSTRYRRDLEQMEEDIKTRSERISSLKQQAANYDAEVKKANALATMHLAKLATATDQLSLGA